MIRLGHALFRLMLFAGVAFFCACTGARPMADGLAPGSGNPPSVPGSLSTHEGNEPEVLELVITVVAVREDRILLESEAAPGDVLEFGWIHSVEHFPWTEFFTINEDGTLLLREMRVRGYGAGIPHQRSLDVSLEDGWIISRGIDEVFPAYRWINSHTAVGQVRLNGSLLFSGSDFPHHEALELRVAPRSKP